MDIEASEFSQAQSELVTAKAQYDLATTNEKRQHDLYDAQGAALKDWQQAQVDLAGAEAALAAVQIVCTFLANRMPKSRLWSNCAGRRQ